MPRKPDLDLDERTACLGREWFAQVRRERREEAAEERRRPAHRDGGTDAEGGLWDRLFGDGDGEAGDD